MSIRSTSRLLERCYPVVSIEKEQLRQVYDKWIVGLPRTPFVYAPHTDDFGKRNITVLFLGNKGSPEEKTSHFARNLKDIANTEGFNLELTEYPFFVRDYLIRLHNGQIVCPQASEHVAQARKALLSQEFSERSSALFRTKHEYFSAVMGNGVIEPKEGGVAPLIAGFGELLSRFGHTKSLRFYMEGGNHYVATNAHGKRQLLMGKHNLTIALHQTRLDGIFAHPLLNLPKAIEIYKKSLTKDQINTVLQTMYAQGLVQSEPGAEKGLITEEEIAESKRLWNLAVQKGFLKPLNLSDECIMNYKDLAATYLAQNAIIKELMGKCFSLGPQSVHFISQASYHLDTFMRPGPKGSFFVQNYAMCIDLLRSIESQSQELLLTNKDKTILRHYLKIAELLDNDLGPLIKNIETELKTAGFVVLPTPGQFIGDPKELLPHSANFINAISGWSEKTQCFYYITSGISLGDRLGNILMGAFSQFLSSYQLGIRVYFIGHNPENPQDFSQAMRVNGQDMKAGVHCMSLEIESDNHTG